MTTPVNDTIVMPISDKTEPIASNNNSFVKAEETSSKTSAEDDGMSNAIITICVSIVLVLFFQSITPAESYLHEYLQIDKRIDRNQMHQNIWPMYTYSHFAALIPLTIAAERYCHYPPIIILAILMRLASSLIHEMSPPGLVWPHQLSLALFGIACAGKAAFRAFVYSVLPSHVYFSMTSYTRGANSAAHVLGGLIGWILKRLQMPWSMFYRIQQICLGTALVSFLVGLQISSRSRSKPSSSLSSIHFHDLIRSWGDVRDQIREAYTCGRLLIYSIWIIVAGAIFEFVMINATTLLHKIDDSATENGLIFGVGKCLAAGLTICLSRYSQFMERNGFRILQMQSWVVVLALALAYGATRISIAYVSLILTCISYDICFCISMTLIASSVPTSIRGVVIFCNTVISLAVQTALQALLSYMRLDIFQYYLAATIVFIVISVFLHLGEYGMRRVARLVPSSSSNGVMA